MASAGDRAAKGFAKGIRTADEQKQQQEQMQQLRMLFDPKQTQNYNLADAERVRDAWQQANQVPQIPYYGGIGGGMGMSAGAGAGGGAAGLPMDPSLFGRQGQGMPPYGATNINRFYGVDPIYDRYITSPQYFQQSRFQRHWGSKDAEPNWADFVAGIFGGTFTPYGGLSPKSRVYDDTYARLKAEALQRNPELAKYWKDPER